jgi:O-antigen ligase
MHFPFGSGAGTFERAFQAAEPAEYINPSYWNHAHNDWWQIVIETGVPGVLASLVFLAWWLWKAIFLAKSRKVSSETTLLRLAIVVGGILLLHSAGDYPLRTPALAAIFGIMCGWMARGHLTTRETSTDSR